MSNALRAALIFGICFNIVSGVMSGNRFYLILAIAMAGTGAAVEAACDRATRRAAARRKE